MPRCLHHHAVRVKDEHAAALVGRVEVPKELPKFLVGKENDDEEVEEEDTER